MLRQLLFIIITLLSFPALAAPPPVINVTPSTLEGCAPLYVVFSNNTSGATSHAWSFNPGTSVVQSPGWTFLTAGTYTVTYTATDASGSSTKSWTITVRPTPVVDFTASPTSGCVDLPVQFTDASTPGGTGTSTYSWVIGTVPASGKTPNYTFTNCGSFDVTLKVKNQYGCEATVTKPNFITAHCKPNVSFAATPTTHCLENGVTQYNSSFTSVVTGGTTPYNYLWDFGNSVGAPLNTQANPANVPYTTSAPASYNVKLTVTDVNGCKAELNKTNYINIEKVTANFTISPTTACVYTPVTVTNTSTPGFTYTSWNWGDFSGNTLGSPATHEYATPGTKTIKLTTQNGACQDTISKTIVINPQPTINFTFTPDKPCPAPQTLNFNATGASSYWWDFGTPPTGTGTTPSHTYANNGFFTVTLVGTDVKGCKDTLTYPDVVKIYDGELDITADTPGGCIPQQVCFNSLLWTNIPGPGKSYYPHSIVSYSWDFGDGGTSTQAAPCHTFTTVGTHIVKLTVLTINGCIFTDTVQVKHDTLPIAGFTATPLRICNRKQVTFTDTSKFFPNTWVWQIIPIPPTTATPVTAYTQHLTHTFTDPGLYKVIFYAAHNFCWDSVVKDPLIRVDLPKADFEYKVSCDTPLKVNFTNKSYGYYGISNLSYKWYFGDPANTTSTVLHPSFVYPSLGNYTAMLVAFNDTLNCSDTFKIPFTLQVPQLSFTASDTTICKDEWVNFTGSVTNGIVIDYFWYVDNVYQNFGATFSHQFLTPGFHTIKMTTYDINNCTHQLIKPNYIVTSKPDVNFSANPTVGCVPMTVNFTDNSTSIPNSPLAALASRYWSFGNNTATTANTTISNLYAGAGDYDVKLIVTDINGCKDSLTKVQYIHAYKPTAAFAADDPDACIGQEVSFTNTSTNGLTATWDFGDGQFSNVYSPKHTYTQLGTYDVRMIVTDAQGCKDTLSMPGYIKITKPNASFNMDDSFAICPPHQVVFTNTSGPNMSTQTHAWNFGPNTSTIASPVYVYAQSGYYTVTLIETDAAGCTDTATAHVNVLGYAGSIQYSPLTGCEPLEVNFTANVTNVPSIIWDFNDGNTLLANNTNPVSHIYTTPGAYVPKIIFSDGGGCTSSSPGNDTIKVDGVFPGFIHGPACEGYMVQFEDTSKGMFTPVNTWAWTFDDGKTAITKKPFHYYPSIGTYPVKLIVTNTKGCTDTITKDVTVNPLPVIGAGADTIICLKDFAQLQGTGGVSYKWEPSGTLSCADCPDPKAYPVRKTEYLVIGTDANGCSDTDRVVIDIQLKTTSAVAQGGEICDEESIVLKASGAQTYVWSPASDVDNASSAQPVASPHKTTNFMVVATEGSCIPDTNYVKVIVHPKPTVRATGSATIIAGKSTPIDASGDLIKRFAWSPSESLTCSDCPSPFASPTKTTTYTIVGYTDFECADSAKVTVTVLCDESQLFIPNTFTPNGDGMNDIFYPRGTGLDKVITFRVYNRWGEIVFDRGEFKLNDKQSGWDGTYNGQALPPDVFVYLVEARCDNGDILKLKGDITLVR